MPTNYLPNLPPPSTRDGDATASQKTRAAAEFPSHECAS